MSEFIASAYGIDPGGCYSEPEAAEKLRIAPGTLGLQLHPCVRG